MKSVLLTSLVIFLVCGCKQSKQPEHTQAEVKAMICGNYQGYYNDGVESISIREEGTFSQKFVQTNHILYDTNGTWSFEKLDDRYLVHFEPFVDQRDAIMHTGTVKRYDGCQATFYDDEPNNIWFFRKINYYIIKDVSEKKKP